MASTRTSISPTSSHASPAAIPSIASRALALDLGREPLTSKGQGTTLTIVRGIEVPHRELEHLRPARDAAERERWRSRIEALRRPLPSEVHGKDGGLSMHRVTGD